MAKQSLINRDKKRARMQARHSARRAALKKQIHDRSLSPEARFAAQLSLDKFPKNASPVRLHNRCAITGRSKGFYRKFRISRIMLREMAARGLLPGVVKASW